VFDATYLWPGAASPVAMGPTGPRPFKGHTGRRVVGGWVVGGFSGSWSLAATALAGCRHTGAGDRHLRQTSSRSSTSAGGVQPWCSRGQLGRPWLDDAGQDRLAGRLGAKEPFALVRSQAKAKVSAGQSGKS
jgi:hypothetical protein